MAYNTSTDYQSIIDSLKKQMAATTDQAQLAALQSQLGAATQSRTEKIASDLNTYGKYADSSTLDSAANLMATRSIGSSYDGQTQQANTYYDQARQNASNAALSRGMARSSYVQDRMANLDVQRANALTGIDRAKGDAIYNAKNSILENYRTNTANALANEKNEFAKTIGAYSNDYAAEINKVTNDGDASNDWKLPYLQAARNEKIEALRQEALKAQAAASSGGSGSGGYGGSGSTPTTNTLYQDMKNSTNPELYLYQNYKKYGLNTTGLSNVLKGYQSWASTYTAPKTGEKGTNAWTAYSWAQAALNKGADPKEALNFLNEQVAGGYITEAQKAEIIQNLEYTER